MSLWVASCVGGSHIIDNYPMSIQNWIIIKFMIEGESFKGESKMKEPDIVSRIGERELLDVLLRQVASLSRENDALRSALAQDRHGGAVVVASHDGGAVLVIHGHHVRLSACKASLIDYE